jgi:hypothetical protein
MAAGGGAAGASLEVVSRGEDEILAIHVIVFRLERQMCCGGRGILLHSSIFS